MDFFPSETSDSGLLEEVIQGFFPKSKAVKSEPLPEQGTLDYSFASSSSGFSDLSMSVSVAGAGGGGVKKRIGDAAYFDCHVPLPQQLENFSGGIPSQPLPFYNPENPSSLQGSHEIMLGLGDGFQYPDLLGALAARMQNA